MALSSVSTIRWTGDELVRLSDFNWAEPQDFDAEKLVIFIHGFTAHGKYLVQFGSFFEKFGFKCFLFNYHSYRGIGKPVESLRWYLEQYDKQTNGTIRRKKILVIAHSMGGLIARAFALDSFGQQVLSGIIMLGTPNGGTITNSRVLSYVIDYGEFLSEVMPEARNPACLSSKELTKSDPGVGGHYIDVLNQAWASASNLPQTLSISGGLNYVVISNNQLKNWSMNRLIQRHFQNACNDGLVLEKSVDLSSIIPGLPSQHYLHFNSYPDYSDINHTYLIHNQALALVMVDWATRTSTSPSSKGSGGASP